MSNPLFAVMRTDDKAIAPSYFGKALSAALGVPAVDVVQRLSRSPSFLARRVTADVAEACRAAVIALEVGVAVVPEERVAEAQEIVVMQRMELQPQGFFTLLRKKPLFVKWDDVIALDLYEREGTAVEVETETKLTPRSRFSVMGLPLGLPYTTETTTKKVERQTFQIQGEIVCFEPWATFKIDETFSFVGLGIKLAPSRQANLLNLMAEAARRAPRAARSETVSQAVEGKPVAFPKSGETVAEDDRLVWKLTNLWLEAAEGRGPLAGR